jgi:hypothetical protein
MSREVCFTWTIHTSPSWNERTSAPWSFDRTVKTVRCPRFSSKHAINASNRCGGNASTSIRQIPRADMFERRSEEFSLTNGRDIGNNNDDSRVQRFLPM